MKINKITIILVLIIFCLVGYIVYDKLNENKETQDKLDDIITIKDTINLEYVNIYLLSDGSSYIAPINEEEIDNLNITKSLKERLSTLYLRAFYQDIYINNYKLKGFKVNLDDKIRSIKKIFVEDNILVAFIKENNTIGIFNYLEYYDLLNTLVEDNYNNLKNILDIENNQIIYLDGSINDFKE